MYERFPWLPAFLLSPDGAGGGGGAGGGDAAADGGGGGGKSDAGAGDGGQGDKGGDKGADKSGAKPVDAAKGGDAAKAANGNVLGDADPKPKDKAKDGDKKDGEDGKKADADKKDAVAKDGDKDKKEDKKEEAKKAPKDGYKLDAKSIELPEGFEIDEEVKKEFDPIASKLDLDQDQYNMVAKAYAQIRKRDLTKWADQVAGWEKAGKEDKEIGGAKYDENVAAARAAIDEFGSPELKQALFYSGYGNHPELLRFCAAVGSALKQGKGILGNQGGAKLSAADKLYGRQQQA